VLGVAVVDDRTTQFAGDQLAHQRDSRRAASQQHRLQLCRLDTGGLHRTPQRLDGFAHHRAHDVLELVAREAHLGAHRRQVHRDGGVAVGRQRLLGRDALGAQGGERLTGGRVAGVGAVKGVAERGTHVCHDGFVEVDSAETLDALWSADGLEPGGGLAQDSSIERATAEVVHGDHVAHLHALGGRVLHGSGDRLGDQRGRAHTGGRDRLAQQVELVGTPVGGVGDGHRVGRTTLPLDDIGQHLSEHRSHQPIRTERGAVENDRCRVAEATLERAGGTGGFLHTAPVGCIAHQQLAVVAQEDDGRNGDRVVAERHHLGTAATHHRSGSERRTQIETQRVAHSAAPFRRCAARQRSVTP
jgi:hypothetical protein